MLNWINKKRNKKGFTLIELVVVIAILGILAAIAVPRFSNVTQSAENRATQANHRILVSAISMYQAANNGNIPTAAALTAEDGIDTVLGDYFEGDIAEFEPTGSSYVFSAGADPVKLVLTSKARDASTDEASGLYTQSWE